MNIKRIISKCRKAWDTATLKAQVSYSQAGEDIIIKYLFDSLKIVRPTYLEIGTNQPLVGNNTYLFYVNGSRGVCIEPDQSLIEIIKSKRPKDTVLNIGIGLSKTSSAPFFLFPPHVNAWNTFSEEEALIRKAQSGINFTIVDVPLEPLNAIIEKFFPKAPNFISIDVEGLDLEILKSIDFERFAPDVICVETISFAFTGHTAIKDGEISKFMECKGYFTYADTYINTIYCRKNLFKK